MASSRGTKRTIQVLESSSSEDPILKRCKLSAGGSSATSSPPRSEPSALVPTDDEGNLAESVSLTSDDGLPTYSGLSHSASSDADCDSDDNDDDEDSDADSDDDSDAATTSSSSTSNVRAFLHDEVDGAGITNLRIGKKPKIRAMEGRKDMLNLRERLDRFLPRLALANAEIEEQRREGTWVGKGVEDVDEEADEGYIEMNLGLGVLEHKDHEMSETSSSSESSDDVEVGLDTKQDIMARLMGRTEAQERAGIEEMDMH
ncbi:MAG: hypothetical protein M1821_000176 [Bathelium mastoideum]|nr:MAG: hypothetical protein M1821_000176 [Bathelium mastoideum]KAI9687790.1 MAG: hypothetical protein M1822_001870 [Bathelium mastoideum]